jgi:CO/xanthine dehydrogenase Mo-binding subunit
MRTGEVTVKRIAATFDIGKAINPMLLEGQIDGGIGTGNLVCTPGKSDPRQGRHPEPRFQDNYLIPTSLDVRQIDAKLLEMHKIHGPYGAKGIGEMSNIPTPATVNNAITNESSSCSSIQSPSGGRSRDW